MARPAPPCRWRAALQRAERAAGAGRAGPAPGAGGHPAGGAAALLWEAPRGQARSCRRLGGVSGRAGQGSPRMLRFLRRTFGRRSMQRYGRGAGRGAGRGGLGGEGDERDGGLRGATAAVAVVGGSGGFPSSPHPGGVVHSAGAPVHIPAAGGSKPVLQCRVLLLDGTEVNVELPVSKAPAKQRLAISHPSSASCPPPPPSPFAGDGVPATPSAGFSLPPSLPRTCCQVRGRASPP